MKIISLSCPPRALIIDLDNTLYSNPAYTTFQEHNLISRLATHLGIDTQAAKDLIARMKKERKEAGQGDTSLGYLFARLGVPITTSIRWREESFIPKDWLLEDALLKKSLQELTSSYILALLSNNPKKVVNESLLALGILEYFSLVVGLDSTGVGKPDSAPFLLAAKNLSLEPQTCASIGDRFDVDLVPAMLLGMGAILIENISDMYELPKRLHNEITKYQL